MDIRHLTPAYAVAPQIEPAELAAAREAGFTAIVCNRPDEEVPGDLSSQAMREAAQAAGLAFIDNPVRNGAMTEQNVEAQAQALGEAAGPVLAYCRSGTRSTVVWALGQAGLMETDAILAAAAEAGYSLEGMRPQIEARAAAR